MKKILLTLCALALIGGARADEGMWIPSLIGKNYSEMVRLGLKLSKEDLYSINHSSMKDAIMQFNGGCTAEMISAQGLLLTNHHCGYGAIASLSTVEKNYLDNGFWAHNKMEELPAKNLNVIFLQRIEDVTDEVAMATKGLSGKKLAEKTAAVYKQIEEEAAQGKKYVANVKEYFNGNQILLLVYKKYTDIRLVGTPPKSLGKFGGDTDNWIWPRHTADFSMFRVYAGKDNEPAEYAADNKPYQPKKFLPVSARGVKEGDYAMIFGYPGRTNRYEVSGGVALAVEEINPSIVHIRDMRLGVMRRHMDADKAVYLKLTSTYASIANYWKYFIGQTEQLKRLHVVEQKQREEARFNEWAQGRENYDGLVGEYNNIYKAYRPYAKHVTYYNECFRASALAKLGAGLEPMEKAIQSGNEDSLKKYTELLKTGRKTVMASFDASTEQELFAETSKMFYKDVPKAQLPDIYERVIFKKYGNAGGDKTFSDYAKYVFTNTFLLDDAKFEAFMKKPTVEAIRKDPAAQYSISFVRNFNEYYQPKLDQYNSDKKDMSKWYVRGLMKMNKDRMYYPDANSTMRISYGQVKSYSPQDGVFYDYFTTLDGLERKYKQGDDEFDAPKELMRLQKRRDYGRWADADGKLHTCFITNNDITGGNSGSPVINANGELIGAAFDGNWEAMSGDIAFDKKYKRTIVCDARYILFLIDKLGGAQNLIDEMDLRN